MGHPMEVLFVIGCLSLWVLFPIGIFLSVSHVDKNTDQVIRLEKLRHTSMPEPRRVSKPKASGFHLPQWATFNRRSLRH